MDDDIPPLLPLEDTPPLRTQSDLHRHWRALMGPLGFSRRRLWLLFLDRDDRATPLLLTVDDVPENPRAREVAALVGSCGETLRSHGLGRVAVLVSRPGAGPLRPSDRRWGRALLDAARHAQVAFAPVHVANDDVVVALTGDDLLAAG